MPLCKIFTNVASGENYRANKTGVWRSTGIPYHLCGSFDPVLFGCKCTDFSLHHTQWFLGTRWRRWLRHCATSRKVEGSIPDGVTGIFH